MPKIRINSDGTREGTQLLVDGADVTEEWITFGYDTEEPYEGDGGGNVRVSYNYRNDNADRFRANREIKGFKQPTETEDTEVVCVGGRKWDMKTSERVARLIVVRPKEVVSDATESEESAEGDE
jgi:hypothetical protein